MSCYVVATRSTEPGPRTNSSQCQRHHRQRPSSILTISTIVDMSSFNFDLSSLSLSHSQTITPPLHLEIKVLTCYLIRQSAAVLFTCSASCFSHGHPGARPLFLYHWYMVRNRITSLYPPPTILHLHCTTLDFDNMIDEQVTIPKARCQCASAHCVQLDKSKCAMHRRVVIGT